MTRFAAVCGLRKSPWLRGGPCHTLRVSSVRGAGLPDLCQSFLVFPWARRHAKVTGTLTHI